MMETLFEPNFILSSVLFILLDKALILLNIILAPKRLVTTPVGVLVGNSSC
jgi:hypothetical protein